MAQHRRRHLHLCLKKSGHFEDSHFQALAKEDRWFERRERKPSWKSIFKQRWWTEARPMQSSTDFVTHQNVWITMIRMNESLHRHLSPAPLRSPAKVCILLKFDETWLNGSFLQKAFCWAARRNAKFTLFHGLPPFLTGEKKKKTPNICGAKAGRIKAEQKAWVTVSETCFQPGLFVWASLFACLRSYSRLRGELETLSQI